MTDTVFLFGASGHAKVVAEVAAASGVAVIGMFDDDPAKAGGLWSNIAVIGGRNDFDQWHQKNRNAKGFVSVGHNPARISISNWLIGQQVSLASLVHPAAAISATAAIGQGALVMPGAIVNADASIGAGTIINSGAIVEHDCVVGDYVHIAPRATLCGGVNIGAGTLVGAGVVVLPGVSVGRNVIIGAGSVVLQDIPDDARVAGAPCRPIKEQP